jgi:DNA-binding MarR family transcriptional regulator
MWCALLAGPVLPTSGTTPEPDSAIVSVMDRDDILDRLEHITIGAVSLTTRALTQAAPGVELTFPQWRVLFILGTQTDGARISEVAARVGVTVPATSRLLRRLQRRGLVALATDDADRRATRARLTATGQGVRIAILQFRRDALRLIAASIAAGGRDDLRVAIEALAAEFDEFG